jgi:hypothetical protein
VGKHTPLPSLELGTEPVISGIDSNVGYTRLYGSNISWRDARTPASKEINPHAVYRRLFPTTQGTAEDRSLLDLTLEDARTLRNRLGRDDQFKLDEYLDSVRAVETRLSYEQAPSAERWKSTTTPEPLKLPTDGIPIDVQHHVRLMLDLMVLAFQTDSTRVATFMFANDVSGRNFSFLPGVRGGHHDMSHHSGEKEKIEQYQRIVRWHAEQFAYLARRLKGIREGEGTLLDNSLLMCGSGMSDGNRHDPRNLPILLAGHGGGAVPGGLHIANPKNTPLCNLYVSMLKHAGVPVISFGDSTGELNLSSMPKKAEGKS